MICSHCGAELAEGTEKCPVCGEEISADVSASELDGTIAMKLSESESIKLSEIKNEISSIWPDWEVEGIIGQGSFGKVYRAKREELGTTIYSAIKVIRIPQNEAESKNLRSEMGLDEQASTAYYKGLVDDCVNEIKLMESLKSAPNIVGIEDYKVKEGEKSGTWTIYIRMELLESFEHFSKDKHFSQEEIAQIGIDICTALESCAKINVMHRDIKPENIFKSELGGYKLGDFGIARKLESSAVWMSKKGTYNYMAPEVYNGSTEYDARSDIYSLGIVLYKLLNNNRFPFLNTEVPSVSYKEVLASLEERMKGKTLPRPVNAGEAFGNVVLTACASDPEKRFTTASAFKNALISVKKSIASGEEPDLGATVSMASASRFTGQMSENVIDPNATIGMGNKNGNPMEYGDQTVAFGAMASGAPYVNTAKKQRKIKKRYLVLLILFLIVSGAGLITYKWYNSPKQRVVRALNNGDYDEASDILEEDPDVADSDVVVDKIKDRISEVRNGYKNKEKSYAKATNELNSIQNMKVSGVKKELDEAFEYLNRLNESRTSFETAESFLSENDYPNAIRQYLLVIEEDPDYDKAMERMTEASDAFRSEQLEHARAKADKEDYQGAIDILQMALETLPNDSELTQQINLYRKDMTTKQKSELLASAEGFAQKKNYKEAIRVLDQFLDANPADADVKAARQEYYNQYISDVLERADEQAQKEEYQAAINIIEMALEDYPDDSKLSQQLTTYRNSYSAKKKADTLDSAESLAQKKQYWDAIKILDTYLKNNPNDADIKTARQKYYNQYIQDVISRADEYIASGDYTSALSVLSGGISNAPDEQQLKVKDAEVKEAHVRAILSEAQGKRDAGDISGAISVLKEGILLYKDNESLTTQLAIYREDHIQSILAEANKKASTEDFEGAVAVVDEGLREYPDENRLKDKKAEVEAKLPVPFNSIMVLNGGFKWNEGVPKDPFGNDYSYATNFYIFVGEYYGSSDCSEYVEVRLYGKYKKITGRLAPYSSIGKNGYGYIKIFADDTLKYTSEEVKQKTDAFTFSADVSGAEYVIIRVYASRGHGSDSGIGAIILSDIMIYPE